MTDSRTIRCGVSSESSIELGIHTTYENLYFIDIDLGAQGTGVFALNLDASRIVVDALVRRWGRAVLEPVAEPGQHFYEATVLAFTGVPWKDMSSADKEKLVEEERKYWAKLRDDGVL